MFTFSIRLLDFFEYYNPSRVHDSFFFQCLNKHSNILGNFKLSSCLPQFARMLDQQTFRSFQKFPIQSFLINGDTRWTRLWLPELVEILRIVLAGKLLGRQNRHGRKASPRGRVDGGWNDGGVLSTVCQRETSSPHHKISPYDLSFAMVCL